MGVVSPMGPCGGGNGRVGGGGKMGGGGLVGAPGCVCELI